MKILIINNSFWNFYNFRINLLSEIKKNIDCDIHLAAPEDEYYNKLNNEFSTYKLEFNSSNTNPFNELFLITKFHSLINKVKPDIILSFTIKPNIYAGLLAKKLKIPIINNISGLGTVFIKQNFLTKIVHFLYKKSFSKYNYIFFRNSFDMKKFKKMELLNKSNYEIIPGSGIDTSNWKNKDSTDINKGRKILFCARLIKDKGIVEYLNAANELKNKYSDISFNVVGKLGVDNKTSIDKKLLDDYINRKIINYLGEAENMKDILTQHDIVVLPSYREGMSRLLLEAASMQRPIITTDVPGCKEIVKDSFNGFLCQPRDYKDLANKIEKMINISEGERIKFGSNGRNFIIENFEEKIVINKYIEIIKKICN